MEEICVRFTEAVTSTSSRQHGGFFGLLKMLGLGTEQARREMADPISKQRVMQRGGFPWALTGLSLLPALLGKGDDTIRSQMSLSREPSCFEEVCRFYQHLQKVSH